MDQARYDKGMQMRRKVLGDEYVDRAVANTDDFNRDFQALLTEYCWGAVWGDDTLKPRERSILNLGMIACLGRMQDARVRAAFPRCAAQRPHAQGTQRHPAADFGLLRVPGRG